MKIREITDKLSKKQAIQIEEYLKLYIQPKPRWLPDFIWRKILHRLLWLDRFD